MNKFILSFFSENWKVKWFFVLLFSRSESEIPILRDQDREMKFQNNSCEFSRNKTLAGYCRIAQYYISLLSGIWNIDDQNRNPNINNRDHLVGQLTMVTVAGVTHDHYYLK